MSDDLPDSNTKPPHMSHTVSSAPVTQGYLRINAGLLPSQNLVMKPYVVTGHPCPMTFALLSKLFESLWRLLLFVFPHIHLKASKSPHLPPCYVNYLLHQKLYCIYLFDTDLHQISIKAL